ncbi:MFS transporter [Planctomonas sp. JC2975]|uniref:MFS transporter n=1 Tax=Planctomonas sp. JC2975 TaxID=2729626 RepID=UPI0014744036|nr:MFS transporter [Planctomonas sp. JC2975]NNC13452.1 MFS transporter [Planctomonas sp. JC2975]
MADVDAPPRTTGLIVVENRGRTTFAFWTAAAVIVTALWASGSPAMVYPLYERAWQLSPAVTTSVFAVYPIVLIVVLLLLGDLSDHIGRRTSILIGLASIATGVLVFALAPSVEWLFVGRVFQGLGVGLSLSPAGAALVELDRTGKRASSVNTAAIAVGLTLATVVGGLLVQYGPAPRALTFWVLLGFIVVVAAAAVLLPRHVRDESLAPWRPRPIHVPKAIRGILAIAALAITLSFAVGSVFISLGAQIVKDVLHTDNAFIAGAVLAIGAAISGVVSIALRRMPPRAAAVLGGVLGALAVIALVASAYESSLPLFIAASLLFGGSSGVLFLGGLGLIAANAAPRHRAGTLSMVYLVAYVGQVLTSVGLGVLATGLGLRTGLDIVGPLLLLLAVATIVVAALAGRRTSTDAASNGGAPRRDGAENRPCPTAGITVD